MNTKTTKSLSPTQLGVTLKVTSGPTGVLKDDWQAISYTVELYRVNPQPFLTTEFKLGIGHVSLKGLERALNTTLGGGYHFTEQEHYMAEAWARKPYANFTDKALQVSVAAKLAKAQKVVPKLDDVMHSLLMDGSCFFDAQSFEDWASDFGYDTDSRKAEAIYKACDEIGRALSRVFTREELASLREWASNF